MNDATLSAPNRDQAVAELSPNWHAIASIFPLLDGEEFDRLCADVRENGLKEPIVRMDGKTIDGRNRELVCHVTGTTPHYVEFTGTVCEAIAHIWSLNRVRRQMDSSQCAIAEARRAALSAEYAATVEGMKAEAAKKVGGRPRKDEKPTEIVPTVSKDERTVSHQRAKAAGTNRKYLEAAEKIVTERPDLGDRIMQGEMTVPQAARVMAGIHQREPGDESEAGGEDPVELTTEQLDAFMASLPLDPQDAFEAAGYVDEALKAISRLKQLLERAGNSPAGRLFNSEAEREALTKLYGRVKSSRPYAVCPKPVNAGNHAGCKVCKGAGFITKEQAGSLPNSMKTFSLHTFEDMDFTPDASATQRRIPIGFTVEDDKDFVAKAGHLSRWLHDQPEKMGLSHRTAEVQRLRQAEEAVWDRYGDLLKLAATVQRNRTMSRSQAV